MQQELRLIIMRQSCDGDMPELKGHFGLLCASDENLALAHFTWEQLAYPPAPAPPHIAWRPSKERGGR